RRGAAGERAHRHALGEQPGNDMPADLAGRSADDNHGVLLPGTTRRRRNCLMPSRRKLARSTGPNADRNSGPASSRPRNSGPVASESRPSALIEQPPAARTFFDQSDSLPKVSGITATSPLTRAPAGVT